MAPASNVAVCTQIWNARLWQAHVHAGGLAGVACRATGMFMRALGTRGPGVHPWPCSWSNCPKPTQREAEVQGGVVL